MSYVPFTYVFLQMLHIFIVSRNTGLILVCTNKWYFSGMSLKIFGLDINIDFVTKDITPKRLEIV